MEFAEKWGKDVEDATNLALKDLKLSIEEVTITVLEEPSKGFLGIGSKLAKVRVEKKGSNTLEGKDKITVEEKKEKTLVNTKKNDSKKPSNLEKLENHVALTFLKETTEKMGLVLSINGEANEDCIYISIEGKDSGTIIGKRGQTLDAIQYLTSLVANKDQENYIRVVVDAENYRAKREKTLEELAERLAEKVIRTRRSVKLEPMNPYERMVIHATLQDNPKVVTKSDGEEPYRRVVIELK